MAEEEPFFHGVDDAFATRHRKSLAARFAVIESTLYQ